MSHFCEHPPEPTDDGTRGAYTQHDLLVLQAETLFPGSTIKKEWTYETYRDEIFHHIKTEYGDQSRAWRLEALCRLTARQVCSLPAPFSEWARRLFEDELPERREQMEAAGLL